MTIRASTKQGIEMTLLEDEMWSGLDHYDMVIEWYHKMYHLKMFHFILGRVKIFTIWPLNFPWVDEKKRGISVKYAA